jgi:hypothetical protein
MEVGLEKLRRMDMSRREFPMKLITIRLVLKIESREEEADLKERREVGAEISRAKRNLAIVSKTTAVLQ